MNEHPPWETLVDLAEGRLALDESIPAREHLAGCTDCRRDFDWITSTTALMGDDHFPPPPAAARARVIAAFARRYPATGTVRRGRPPFLAGVAALAALLLLALLLGRGRLFPSQPAAPPTLLPTPAQGTPAATPPVIVPPDQSTPAAGTTESTPAADASPISTPPVEATPSPTPAPSSPIPPPALAPSMTPSPTGPTPVPPPLLSPAATPTRPYPTYTPDPGERRLFGLVQSRPPGALGGWQIGSQRFEVTEETQVRDEALLTVGSCARVDYEPPARVVEIRPDDADKCVPESGDGG